MKYYFSYFIGEQKKTGRELLSILHREAFFSCYPRDGKVYLVEKKKKNALLSFVNGVLGWLDGLNRKKCDDILKAIKNDDAALIYIDGSNYGRLAKEVKKHAPNTKVITFFHNVESKFFWGAFKAKPGFRSAAVLLCNYVTELMAVKYSDVLVCLNERDSNLLSLFYSGAENKEKAILPMCLKGSSRLSSNAQEVQGTCARKSGLFVGGAFYANLQGVRWFCKNVAPYLDCDLFIVGKGFDAYRIELEAANNVRVVGEVDDVEEWYYKCDFVFSPIFDGSGMKTKTAEALKYGRPIFGTSETFVGYEDHLSGVGARCNNAVEFLKEIRDFSCDNKTFIRKDLCKIFDDHYSFAAMTANMRRLLSD
jgi:hypothetical protein